MSDYRSLWTHLDDTLKLDIPITAELLSLLEQERKALETRQYGEFEQIISKKQQWLKQLEQHANERQKQLQLAGFNDEKTTLETIDKQAPEVAKAWRKLAEQWGQCKDLNDTNELIAKRTRQVVSQLLNIVRGQTNQTKLYTKEGNPQNTGDGRSITSA